MGRPLNNIDEYIGKRFSKLTILSKAGIIKFGRQNYQLVKVRCDCGNEKVMKIANVKNGHIESCGCFRGYKPIKHGLSGANNTCHPLYSVWATMKTRCYNKNHPSYKRWGAKGVRVCDEWLNDFTSFYNWCIANGWKQGLQIDKDIIALNLGAKADLYSPERCSIVTAKTNLEYRNSKQKV